MWQKCPVCEGQGSVGVGYPTGQVCSVCSGHKIISSIDGRPPKTETYYTTSVEGKQLIQEMGIDPDKLKGQ